MTQISVPSGWATTSSSHAPFSVSLDRSACKRASARALPIADTGTVRVLAKARECNRPFRTRRLRTQATHTPEQVLGHALFGPFTFSCLGANGAPLELQ